MIKVYRDKDNRAYWDERWSSAGVDQDKFLNEDIYPIKYANMVVRGPESDILEAGCGAGRLFFHYKNLGYNIKGIEYSRPAVNNIQARDPQADIVRGSITDLPYPDGLFDVVLAFGLYHNLESEDEVARAFSETARVLKPGGRLLASVRFDSLENRLIEAVVRYRKRDTEFNKLHRLHFEEKDLEYYLGANGLKIENMIFIRNVSLLFKFDFFRAGDMKSKRFAEAHARSKGFELNFTGKALDSFLHNVFPKQFSNLIIVIASRN